MESVRAGHGGCFCVRLWCIWSGWWHGVFSWLCSHHLRRSMVARVVVLSLFETDFEI